MFQVNSPWRLILPTLPLMGFAFKMAYDASALENQAVCKLASLINTYNDQIPPACWKKRHDIQVLNCFLVEGNSTAAFKRLVQDFQESRDQYLRAIEMKTIAVVLMVFSIIVLHIPLPNR